MFVRTVTNNELETAMSKYVKMVSKFVDGNVKARYVSSDEGWQIGRIAVFKALQSYDPDRGCKFSTMLFSCLKHEFQNVASVEKRWRRNTDLLRSMHRKDSYEVDAIHEIDINSIKGHSGYNIFYSYCVEKKTITEIGREVGISPHSVNTVLKRFFKVNRRYIDKSVYN